MTLNEYLRNQSFYPVLEQPFPKGKYFLFDFSESNEELNQIDLNSRKEFESYIEEKIKAEKATFGVGKYAEDRVLYRRFNLFDSDEKRSFHLGIDLWKAAGTSIYNPLDGRVHSFRDNEATGDYGPTIILEHDYPDGKFYTLYGHLSKGSLGGLYKEKVVNAGEKLAELGAWEVNVNWPPHLHFQIIKDLNGMEGDFPGVCRFSEREPFMENCPDPNLMLKIPGI